MNSVCKYCGGTFNGGRQRAGHESRCSMNPTPNKGYAGPITCEEKQRASIISRAANKKYWTPERRAEQSVRMKQIVLQNPDSYSKSNVSGRVKMYDIHDTNGPTKVKGTWELQVAQTLNTHNVRWTNTITPIPYMWNNTWHMYFPDFLLLDTGILIEVKGYETERDAAKWKSVQGPLIVIRKLDMISLDEILKQAGGW